MNKVLINIIVAVLSFVLFPLFSATYADQITISNQALSGGDYSWDDARSDMNDNFTELYVHWGLITITQAVNLDTLDATATANAVQVSELVTLSGLAAHSTDFGLFTGITIPDNSTLKPALQALETEVETKQDALTFGILDNNTVTIDSTTIAENEYSIFTPLGLKSFSIAEVKIDLSIENVDNTSDANKPVSTDQATAIGLKEDTLPTVSEDGSFLTSTIAAVRSFLTIAETKTALSINNVDNTSDANKPVSTATQTEIDTKVESTTPTVAGNIPVYTGTDGTEIEDSGASIDSNGIVTPPVSGGGGLTIKDEDAPSATDKSMSEVRGAYVDGVEDAENGSISFWAKIAGTMTSIFDYNPTTDTVDFDKPVTGTFNLDASGFNGNLATTDDTLQEVAQAVDDLSASSSITDGNTANDITVWDGDSWEPMALTSHPDYVALLNALTAAGLNAFTWVFTTPSDSGVTYYIDATTASFVYAITDTSTDYAPAGVQWQIDSGGYTSNDCASVTNCSVTGLTDNSSNTVQFQVSDDKGTPNTGESEEITVVVDTTLPVIVADADSTHSGTTDSITAGCVLTETNPATIAVTATAVNATPTSPTVSGTYPNYDTEALTPDDDSSTITVTFAATDLAGNTATGTDLIQAFTYSAPASALLNETFEGTGYVDGTWSETNPNGTINEDYTTTVLSGSQSLYMEGADYQDVFTESKSFTGGATTYIAFLLRIPDSFASGTQPIKLFDSADGAIGEMTISSGLQVQMQMEGAGIYYGPTLSVDTTYAIFLDISQGTGSDAECGVTVEEYVSGTSISKGTQDGTSDDGTSTAVLDHIQILVDYANSFIVDEIIIDTTEITSLDVNDGGFD